ncbi:hypothetical protein BU16DRAFT_543491 [Lophium mytilinum]|uniref:Uncharacterized protein n=1 Tax=Lophium mytilinum TaxID=390894 RepID=A0A6A6QGU9_9PEZI|nr:hypothetical protein BU16DRAFT_543491 [Lophium mytilinum]
MERTIKSQDAVAGRILWLPPFVEVPAGAVERVRGKGPVDEKMFNHPVVVCSRPWSASEGQDSLGSRAHFHIITSFGGKTLAEMYGKTSDFHRQRRLNYLPVDPAPAHPDGLPSLFLSEGAQLRWHSYINVGEIYAIDLNFLWTYSNKKTPGATDFHLGWNSLRHLRRRAETLTQYRIDPQFPAASFPSITFGTKAVKSNRPYRIPTGELEDLEILERPVPNYSTKPWIENIPEDSYPATEAMVVSCHEHTPAPTRVWESSQATEVVIARHDERSG